MRMHAHVHVCMHACVQKAKGPASRRKRRSAFEFPGGGFGGEGSGGRAPVRYSCDPWGNTTTAAPRYLYHETISLGASPVPERGGMLLHVMILYDMIQLYDTN